MRIRTSLDTSTIDHQLCAASRAVLCSDGLSNAFHVGGGSRTRSQPSEAPCLRHGSADTRKSRHRSRTKGRIVAATRSLLGVLPK